MSKANLRSLLGQLHERLAHAEALDAESRALLLTVARDIEKALAADAPAPAAAAGEPLETLAVRFEADHPALAGVLRQIMDTLGKAGI